MKKESLKDILKLVKDKEIWISRDRYITVEDLIKLIKKEDYIIRYRHDESCLCDKCMTEWRKEEHASGRCCRQAI